MICRTEEGTFDVHHITYERLGHEAMEDLRVLCRKHHDWEHLRPEWKKGSKERRVHKPIKPLFKYFKKCHTREQEGSRDRRLRKRIEQYEQEMAQAWSRW